LVARNTLDANLMAGFVAAPTSLFVSSLDEPVISGDSARWDVHAVRRILPSWSSETIAALVMGQKPQAAGALLLNRYGLKTPAQVALQPAWWPYLPFLSFRIQVEVQE
jgi:hypothetical protein